jgi:hypothetical protein
MTSTTAPTVREQPTAPVTTARGDLPGVSTEHTSSRAERLLADTGVEYLDLVTPELAAPDLASLDERELASQIGWVNDTYAATLRAYEDACESLGNVLTEQIARRVLTLHPTAYMIQVHPAAEFHTDPHTGKADPTCTGHEARLVPGQIMTADGASLGVLDAMDPVCYWLERLTPLMLDSQDAVLCLPSRDWAFGSVEDAIDSFDDSFDDGGY